MKYLLVATLALASLTACTHKHKRGENMPNLEGMSFEELRAWKTNYLAKKTELIKQEQACIDKATDKPGLKKCTEDIHAKWVADMKEQKKN